MKTLVCCQNNCVLQLRNTKAMISSVGNMLSCYTNYGIYIVVTGDVLCKTICTNISFTGYVSWNTYFDWIVLGIETFGFRFQ